MRLPIAFITCLAIVLPARIQAQDIRNPPGTEPAPSRCALSPDAKVLYIPRPDDRIEAINIENGKSLWTSRDRAKPLAAQKDALFVLLNEKPGIVRLAVMDPVSGKIAKQSDAYTLPAPESSLVVFAGSFGKKFYLSMKRGENPKDKPAKQKAFLGTLFFDPLTAKFELKDEQVGSAFIAKPPVTVAKLEKAKNLPVANFQNYPGFVSNNRFVQIFYGRNTMSAFVLSVQWDKATGKHLETKEIFVNRMGNTLGTIFPVAAGRYVVFRAPDGESGGFYSSETGKELFSVPKTFQLVWWPVGSLVIGLERPPAGADAAPPKLHAYNLATGKLVWSHACHELVAR